MSDMVPLLAARGYDTCMTHEYMMIHDEDAEKLHLFTLRAEGCILCVCVWLLVMKANTQINAKPLE